MSDLDKYRAEKKRSDALMGQFALMGDAALEAGLLRQLEMAEYWAGHAVTDGQRAAMREQAAHIRKSLAKLG